MTFRGSLAPLAYPVGGGPSRAPVVRESRPPDAPKPRLLDRVREAIRARHYSRRTEEAYVAWIRRYIVFHGKRHPAEMGAPEVTKFLTSLAVDGHVAASTQNQALSALLFLYKDVLEVDLPWLDGIVRAKRPARLPVVLTRDEVRAVLQRLEGAPRLMACLLYGLHARPEPRTRRRPEPGRPDVRAVTSPAASAGACAKIRDAISQPIQVWPRLPDRSQDGESMGPDPVTTPHSAVGIGRPASQHLPGYAEQPIQSPNSSWAASYRTGPRAGRSFVAPGDAYTQLIAFLDRHAVQYRLIDHAPEGRTEIVSPMRGNALSQAAKCIVLMVKIGKKVTKYVLAVVPGDVRVDLNAVKALMKGTYVSFASPDTAEKLAGSVAGTVLPFSFNPDLELVVDPSLLENDELYFNAARLDQSIVLKTSDYATLAKPRLERIAEVRGTGPGLVTGR